jgi:competence protein ComEC
VSDRAAVALAVAVAVGARWSGPVPLVLALLVVGAAWARHHPGLLCLGGLLLAASLGHRAWAGLVPPPPAPVAEQRVTLLTDPEVDGDHVEAVARLGRRHVEVVAPVGPEGDVLAARLAGERLVVSGTSVPVSDRPDLAVRHVASRVLVDEVGAHDAGGPASRVANAVRRVVVQGARPLGDEATALFTGILFGDDRGQSPAVTDDFRAAGLTHLLAVSGQNVAFVLVVVGPALRRLGLVARFTAVLGVLAFFALLTRFEPSVLRATAMAAVAAGHVLGGRELSRHRALALAVAGLLLVDPVLVHSVGFALSVAATAGILLLAPRLEARVPGPRLVVVPLAVTLAAEIAVAPLLAAVFGGVPLVSLPANLLAGPAAGLVMAWGLVAGPIAGVVPGLAVVAHLPDRLALGWLHSVASGAAAVPLGELRSVHLVVLAGLVLLARWRPARRPAVLAAVVLLALPALALARRPVLIGVPVATGATLWRDGPAVVVRLDGRARADRVLSGLRRVGVRRVGLVLVGDGPTEAAEAIAERGGTRIVGLDRAAGRLRQGAFTAEVLEGTRWLVRSAPPTGGSVRSAGARRARSPPLRGGFASTRRGRGRWCRPRAGDADGGRRSRSRRRRRPGRRGPRRAGGGPERRRSTAHRRPRDGPRRAGAGHHPGGAGRGHP